MNPNPLQTNDRAMQFRDAALVATVLMLISAATLFFPTHGYEILSVDSARYAFDLTVFLFSSWITYFGTLTGLTIYVTSKQSNDGK